MPSIKVLPKQVSELIAAGEVVERPSSVIKELVENSIDAGATLITVEIKNGGVTFMRVTDNGCGINREDVTTAFLRHATSKVSTEDDLNGIATLGFRGEALAAISSVSRVEMLTKTRDSEMGTSYSGAGGEGITVSDAGCPDGTTIIVRDLFFNTPARMKFLKKDVAEGNSVGAILDHIALSHPEISFKFIRDGKSVFNTPGDGKLGSAIYAVCGREFASALIPVEGELSGIKVKGYVCKPMACRPKRNAQFVFLNGRYVRSGTVSSALEAAYKNMAMVGRYPACVLHLTVPYGAVDINVHPAKTEVRFSDERRIFDCVMFSVKNALAKGDERPEMRLPKASGQIRMTTEEYKQTVLPGIDKKREDPIAAYTKMINDAKRNIGNGGFAQTGGYNGGFNIKPPETKETQETEDNKVFPWVETKTATIDKVLDEDVVTAINKLNEAENEPVTEAVKIPEITVESPVLEAFKDDKNEVALPEAPAVDIAEPEEEIPQKITFVGEVFATYIIVQKGESLWLVDKHAAHERMLFNKLKDNAEVSPQMLLTPIQVVLRREDYTIITENIELLQNAGFEVEDYGDSTVLVRSVPSALGKEDVSALMFQIAGSLADRNAVEVERLERIYETVSCRAAVKAGNLSSKEELEALATAVLSSKEIMYCPHGRPVAIELSRREIEKQFGRIQ